MIRNRFSGFVAIDAMVSLIPILLILIILIETVSFFSNETATGAHHQKIFNRLVGIADYVVKSGAVVEEGEIRYPNWIDEKKLNAITIETLRDGSDLSSLYIGVKSPSLSYSVCIYRIVVIGSEKQIKQLFVCGG
ncbi:Uncharacterised protein [Candidatus Bilamarchaeum dharawalense]|uniref:TadE-like protein n=1 Tax=Candidatus Bilamarchaeum dharawalense TaxID=2885759 RepID=A0A5E4LRG2_9ARCH|nr:Uncharacterised protein [Candidatus Bilamarchaeum dharawalense]